MDVSSGISYSYLVENAILNVGVQNPGSTDLFLVECHSVTDCTFSLISFSGTHQKAAWYFWMCIAHFWSIYE